MDFTGAVEEAEEEEASDAQPSPIAEEEEAAPAQSSRTTRKLRLTAVANEEKPATRRSTRAKEQPMEPEDDKENPYVPEKATKRGKAAAKGKAKGRGKAKAAEQEEEEARPKRATRSRRAMASVN